jgi:Fe-S cluster assembly protein SufD
MNSAMDILGHIGGLPELRDEHWQFAPLRALRALQDWRHVPAPGAAILATPLPAATPGYAQLVCIDGYPVAGDLLASVQTTSAAAAGAADRDMRLAALPAASGLPGLRLVLAGARQVELWFVCSGSAGVAYPRLQLELAPNASITLVERHVGQLRGTTLACSDFRLQLAEGSRLMHYRLLGLAGGGLCFDQLQARLADRSAYAVFHIAANGGLSRTTALVELAGRAARCEWHSVVNLHSGQHSDQLLRVLHTGPATESLCRYRGIAGDQSRASCAADVQVNSAARGARVQQSLKGLNDGVGAGVNLRPRLTIDTDDIQAQHGATTGQLDEQLLFYLRSRGLDLESATRLLKWAFLSDVLAAIDEPAVRRAAETLAGGGPAP